MAGEGDRILRCEAALPSSAPGDSQSDSDSLPRSSAAASGLHGDEAARRLRRAAAALLLLAALVIALLLAADRPTIPLSAQAVLVPGANLSLSRDYEPIDAQAMGECTASILAAGLFTANLGLIIRSTMVTCPVGKLLEVLFEDNDPWFPNGTLKPESRRLAADDRRLAEVADPETRQAFIRMATAKRRALADLRSDNKTLRHLFETFLEEQRRALKAVCARDVLEFASASAITAEYCELAEQTCKSDRPFKQECRKAVTDIVNRFPRAARFAAQMAVRCPQRSKVFQPVDIEFQPDVSYNCEGRMEGVAWHISAIGARVQTAIDSCPAHEKRPPKINYGGCVTMIVSAAAYLGASAIALDAAGVLDCVNMTKLDLALAELAAKGSEKAYEQLVNAQDGRNLKCARDIIAAIRTMGLASMKATSAAEFCGGFHTPCGRDVAAAATAFTASVEAFVLATYQCRLHPFHKADDVEDRNVQCASLTASALKEMSVTAALSFDASQSCRLTNSAAGACASTVSTALAGFSYMMERMALMVSNCKPPGVQSGAEAYRCGHLMEHIGQATLVASTSIGAATINCGLGMRPSPTRKFSLNRRFWVPR